MAQHLPAASIAFADRSGCAGFLTSKTEYPAGGGSAETTTYEYSSRGELLRVMLPDGRTVEYEHDPLGRRVAKKIDGATVEKYLWAGMTELLAVYDGSGNLKYRFEGAKVVTTSGALYMLTDQVGTVRGLVSSDGTLVKTIAYDSFGNVIGTGGTTPSLDFPLGFAGGLYDEDTGLIRFGYRDYDPETGRWTAKDPMRFHSSDVNLYSYCALNPIQFTDPSGLEMTPEQAQILLDMLDYEAEHGTRAMLAMYTNTGFVKRWGTPAGPAIDDAPLDLPFRDEPIDLDWWIEMNRAPGGALGYMAMKMLWNVTRAIAEGNLQKWTWPFEDPKECVAYDELTNGKTQLRDLYTREWLEAHLKAKPTNSDGASSSSK